MSMGKAEALRQIIEFGIRREEAFTSLLDNSWNCESELIVASSQQLAGVLQKYVSGCISSEELEEWAMFIDCRDDIDSAQIEDYIYALVNPQLMGDIDKDKIAKMVGLLR